MKKLLVGLSLVFVCVVAIAQTVSIDWKVDGNIYAQNTCEYGGTLTVPSTPPTKYGYTFRGWRKNYTPIEYIESIGTQWIDTGVITNNDVVRIDMDIKLTDISRNFQFCSVSIGDFVDAGRGVALGVRGKEWSMILPGFSYNTFGTASTDRIQFTWTITLDGKSEATGDLIKTTTDSRFFGPNLAWRQESWHLVQGYTDFYSAKIYLNNVLVRDFIPVLDPAGTPCMFDKVETKFYYNQGTGDFIAGPVLQ